MSPSLPASEDTSSIPLVVALRSARAALGWSQRQLADQAGLAKVTIARLEAGMISPNPSTVAQIVLTMERHGVSLVLNQPNGGFTMAVHPAAVDPQAAKLTPATQAGLVETGLPVRTSREGRNRSVPNPQEKPQRVFVRGLAGRRISADGVTEPPLAGPARDGVAPE